MPAGGRDTRYSSSGRASGGASSGRSGGSARGIGRLTGGTSSASFFGRAKAVVSKGTKAKKAAEVAKRAAARKASDEWMYGTPSQRAAAAKTQEAWRKSLGGRQYAKDVEAKAKKAADAKKPRDTATWEGTQRAKDKAAAERAAAKKAADKKAKADQMKRNAQGRVQGMSVSLTRGKPRIY